VDDGVVEFRDVIRRRQMIRHFDPQRPVPAEALHRVLEHARRAPSAGHTQGWAFLVLEKPGDRELFWSVSSNVGAASGWLERMRTAPVLVIVLSSEQAYRDRYREPDKRPEDPGGPEGPEHEFAVPYWHVDAGFAALIMLLTAVDEGLGACFFGIDSATTEPTMRAFGVPGSFTPVGVVAIGHPAPGPRSPSLRRGRRPVADVVHYGSWRGAR
jgi:nitroreductase